MPLFTKGDRKVCFIHIPKTGGTSIVRFVKEDVKLSFKAETKAEPLTVNPQHFRYVDLQELLGENFCDWSFAIVRNPYDRLESEYRYRSLQLPKGQELIKFSTWVIGEIYKTKENPMYSDNHIRPQSDFLESGINIYKLEDGFEALKIKLSHYFGIDMSHKIPIANKSSNLALTWTDDALAACNEFYYEDFKAFKYSMRPSPPITAGMRKQWSKIGLGYLSNRFFLKSRRSIRGFLRRLRSQ